MSRSTEEALAAGSNAFKAFDTTSNPDKWKDNESACEPLTADKAQLTIVTQIHDASHADIKNTTVQVGAVVHDTATVTGAVSGFDPTGAISFTLNGNPVANEDPAEAGYTASTVDSDPLAGGSYIFKATVAGDDNYIGDDSPDEPLSVRTFVYTMGFWGNTNGQALLAANHAFDAGNQVTLGEPNVNGTDLRCNLLEA